MIRANKFAKRGTEITGKTAGPRVVKKWVKSGVSRSRQVYELEDGTPCDWEGSPLNEIEHVHSHALHTDPSYYSNGKCRFRPGRDENDRRGITHIPDLKHKVAEKEGLFPYVKGKGPAPFTSHRKKDEYFKRYGYEEIGFEDEARNT